MNAAAEYATADRGDREKGIRRMKQKVLTWAGIAFAVFFIAANPKGAADIARAIGATVIDIARGFMDFLSSLL